MLLGMKDGQDAQTEHKKCKSTNLYADVAVIECFLQSLRETFRQVLSHSRLKAISPHLDG